MTLLDQTLLLALLAGAFLAQSSNAQVTIDNTSVRQTFTHTYEFRSGATVEDPVNYGDAFVSAPSVTGSFSATDVKGININGGIDRSGANRGSLVTASQNSTVTGGGSVDVVASGSTSAKTEDAALTSTSGSSEFKFQADGSSRLYINFTIAGNFTRDVSLSGLFSASSKAIHDVVIPPYYISPGVLVSPDPGAFAIGSASYSLSRGNTAIFGAGVGGNRGTYSSSQNLSFSGRLAPGNYTLSLVASVSSYSHQTSDPAGSAVNASAAFSNFHLSMTAGPALSGSVIAGIHQVAISGGGAATVGGINADFARVDSTAGDFTGNYQVMTEADLLAARPELTLGDFDFKLAGDAVQLWDLSFSGDHSGQTELVFHYDSSLLADGMLEGDLKIAHFINGNWVLQDGIVDAATDTITIKTDSFSPFVLTTTPIPVPEPTACALLLLSSLGFIIQARRFVGKSDRSFNQ